MVWFLSFWSICGVITMVWSAYIDHIKFEQPVTVIDVICFPFIFVTGPIGLVVCAEVDKSFFSKFFKKELWSVKKSKKS